MGRPRKPVEQLKLHGTFRKDYHGGRVQAEKPRSEPLKPAGMPAAARAIWDRLVKLRPEWIDGTDTESLESACRLWVAYRAALKAAEKYPLDADTVSAVVKYGAQWERMSVRFGLTPLDRSRLGQQMGTPDDKPSSVVARKRS